MADDAGQLLHRPLLFDRAPVDVPTRQRISLDDILRWQEHGWIDPDSRFELIDGTIINMASEGELHLNLKAELTTWFVKAVSPQRMVYPDGTLMLSRYDAPEPDLYVLETDTPTHPVDVERLHLVIEVADSSLGHDLVDKAALYGRYGVQEYWVVDGQARVTHVFRRAERTEYGPPERVPFAEVLRPHRLAEIGLRMNELRYLRNSPR